MTEFSNPDAKFVNFFIRATSPQCERQGDGSLDGEPPIARPVPAGSEIIGYPRLPLGGALFSDAEVLTVHYMVADKGAEIFPCEGGQAVFRRVDGERNLVPQYTSGGSGAATVAMLALDAGHAPHSDFIRNFQILTLADALQCLKEFDGVECCHESFTMRNADEYERTRRQLAIIEEKTRENKDEYHSPKRSVVILCRADNEKWGAAFLIIDAIDRTMNRATVREATHGWLIDVELAALERYLGAEIFEHIAVETPSFI